MESLITPALQSRLERLRDDETATFNASIPRSRAWLADAAQLMPNGVPVSWMSGFWRHSPVVAVSGSGLRTISSTMPPSSRPTIWITPPERRGSMPW